MVVKNYVVIYEDSNGEPQSFRLMAPSSDYARNTTIELVPEARKIVRAYQDPCWD